MNFSEIFQIGIGILRTVVSDTKAILAQTGDAASNVTEADEVPIWSHIGFVYRPPKAEAGKRSAEAVAIRNGDGDVIIATRDLRGLELAGNLEEGETCIYAPGEDGKAQARILLKANGNIALYTAKGNATGGDSVTVQCNADGEIHLGSPFGGISLTSDALIIAHRDGSAIKLDSGGITLIGKAVALNGSSVSLGANATQPVVWGPAGISGVGSISVKVAM